MSRADRLRLRALLGERSAGQLAAQLSRRLGLQQQPAGRGPPQLQLRKRQMHAYAVVRM